MSRESGGNLAVGVVAGGMTPAGVAVAVMDEMVSRDAARAQVWADKINMLADPVTVYAGSDGYWNTTGEIFDATGPACLVGAENDGQENKAWVRFTGIPATLDGDAIRVKLTGYRHDGAPEPSFASDITIRIKAVAAANQAEPTSYTEADALSLTTEYVDWVIPAGGLNDVESWTSPTLETLIDALVTAGWTPGNAVVLVLAVESGRNGDFVNFLQDGFTLTYTTM